MIQINGRAPTDLPLLRLPLQSSLILRLQHQQVHLDLRAYQLERRLELELESLLG